MAISFSVLKRSLRQLWCRKHLPFIYSLVASNGSLCKQSKTFLVLTQNVKIVFMLQIKVLSPLMINANDFKKDLLLGILLVHLYCRLLPLYWISCSYNGSHDTEGQEPSQNTHL